MTWRPLSKRGQPDPRLDEPFEGLPSHLKEPVLTWVGDALWLREAGHREPSRDALEQIQLRLRLQRPLPLNIPHDALADLLDRAHNDETFALDVVDFCLYWLEGLVGYYQLTGSRAQKLATMLVVGGSAWEVVPVADDEHPRFRLQRRAVGPVREAVMELPPSSRAHQHLVTAWNQLVGRDPDPSSAYREAVRAVEAAAKPIVLPDNDRATLGTMIAAMRDKPEKWQVTLGTVDRVRQMMETVWTNQLDRHGTDDESVPLMVGLDEADAAVHMCLTLARLFVGGHVRPVAVG